MGGEGSLDKNQVKKYIAKGTGSEIPANTSLYDVVAAVKAKTDNLPGDPGDQSAIEAAITAAHATTDGKVDATKAVADAVKAKTDGLPADPSSETSLTALDALIDSVRTELTFQQQADATLSQADPVSAQLYEVLAATANVRLIGIEADITWAVTQPTPLEVVVTIDGISVVFAITNPVSATAYFASLVTAAASAQVLETTDRLAQGRPFLLEGRSVRVQIRITWAVTQPTPLNCRVKYAKR